MKNIIKKYITKEMSAARKLITKKLDAFIIVTIIMILATITVFVFGEIIHNNFIITHCAFIALVIEIPELLIIGLRLQELRNERSK